MQISVLNLSVGYLQPTASDHKSESSLSIHYGYRIHIYQTGADYTHKSNTFIQT